MTLPVVKVEVGFASAPLATQTFTDVSAYVRAGSTRRGRSTELDSFSPGTAQLTLANADRRFDPEHAAGPYYGNLAPNKVVKVTCTYGGVTYPLFYGFADGWPQTYNGNTDATVALAATDGFKLLNRTRLPGSVYAAEVAKDAPVAQWHLGEQSGATAADSSGNSYDGLYNRTDSAHGVPSLVDGQTDGAALFDGRINGDYVDVSNPNARVLTPPYWVEMWVKADLAVVATFAPGVAGVAFWQPGPATSDIVAVSGEVANPGAGTPERVRCVVGTNIWFTAANDVLGVTRSTGTILDGRRHHVLFYVPDSSNRFMYLDGTYRVQTFQAVAASGPATLQIGGAAVSYGLRSFPGVVDEVALYRSSLGDYIAGGVRAAAHYAAGVTPWAGDNAGTRIGRVLNLAKVGWPAALRAIDTGQTVLGTATLGGRLALDYLQAVERTEQGRLFIDGAGKIVFHSRDRDLTATRATTSQATFTDDGTGIDYLTSPFAFTRDERQVFNEVSASRDGGQTVTVTDATSTAAYGVLSHSISGLLCSTDIEVREVANRVLWTHKTPQTRVETFTVRPEKAPANWPAVLALEIGDRVTVKRFPQSVGTQISKDFLVQQIAHTFDPGDWTVSITASPVDTTSYFAWGTTGQWGGPALWR